jgi:hypothetical protein
MLQSELPLDENVDAKHELDGRQRVHQETIRPSISHADFADVTWSFSRKPIQQRNHFGADLMRWKLQRRKRVVVIGRLTPRQLVAQRSSPTDLEPELGCGGQIR